MPTHTSAQDVRRINPQALHARMAGGEAVIPIDVRTTDARLFLPVQLPNARWLPIAGIVQRAHTLPREALIALY